MAGVEPHPTRPPQEDVENLNPSSSTLIGLHRINLGMEVPNPETKPYSISHHPGRPSVIFNKSEKDAFIKRWQHVLVAKFSHGRPALEAIKQFFNHQNFQGDIKVASYDSKHIIVECGQFTDFVQIWIKKVWFIKGFTARFFKWDENFHPGFESSIAPVWIHLPCLPLFLYEERALLKIASAIGRPLFIDKNNINKTKLGYATICVETDVAKPLIDQLCLRFVGKGSLGRSDCFVQQVLYDFIPHHCSYCHHLGHKFEVCKRRVEQNQGSEKQGKDKGLGVTPTTLEISKEEVACSHVILSELDSGVLEKGILGDVHISFSTAHEEEFLEEELALEEGELVETCSISEGAETNLPAGTAFTKGAAGSAGAEDAAWDAETDRIAVGGSCELNIGTAENGGISGSVGVARPAGETDFALDVRSNASSKLLPGAGHAADTNFFSEVGKHDTRGSVGLARYAEDAGLTRYAGVVQNVQTKPATELVSAEDAAETARDMPAAGKGAAGQKIAMAFGGMPAAGEGAAGQPIAGSFEVKNRDIKKGINQLAGMLLQSASLGHVPMLVEDSVQAGSEMDGQMKLLGNHSRLEADLEGQTHASCKDHSLQEEHGDKDSNDVLLACSPGSVVRQNTLNNQHSSKHEGTPALLRCTRKLSSSAAEFTPGILLQRIPLTQDIAYDLSSPARTGETAGHHFEQAEGCDKGKNQLKGMLVKNTKDGGQQQIVKNLHALKIRESFLSDDMRDIIPAFKCKSVPTSPSASRKRSDYSLYSPVFSPATKALRIKYGCDLSSNSDCGWSDSE